MSGWKNPKRVDLHCHSDASNKAAEVVLNAIHCPECYSDPLEVHAQATLRGMDFVTITDHDTIDGVTALHAARSNVLMGEEVTCWFPEDQCKLHLLVFGIDVGQHESLRQRAENIYDVAAYIEAQQIAHSVAHPIYRQNDKLERWHVERLLLLFKGFECLNGAHSPLHREAFEPMLDRLTPDAIQRLSETHDLQPRWPEPWVKARTGGSDDHGLLNIGRTWTEFPPEAETIAQLLDCLRSGNCRPGGEAGSSAKLAHTFYGIAVRYYGRHIMPPAATPNLTTSLLQTIVGEKPAPSRVQLAGAVVRSKLRKLRAAIARPLARAQPPAQHTSILKQLFISSFLERAHEHPQLREVISRGLPPLGEHAEMFRLVSQINHDISEGLAAAMTKSINDASFTGLFDSIAAILAQQFVLSPYYFAVFHQNKERHLLRQITAQHTPKTAKSLKVALFTDTFDEINGVGRFLHDILGEAAPLGRHLTIHTCCRTPGSANTSDTFAVRKNFMPLLSLPLPYYDEILLNFPPVLDVLEWSDRQQFDVVHVSTPGPMGLCGWLVARMLRVPLVCTYHTDFPAYVDKLTRDHRVTNGTTAYMRWFYNQATTVLTRSKSYRFHLRDLGIADEKILPIQPAVDARKFHPRRTLGDIWQELNVREPLRLLYVGRISREKNLALLARIFKTLCEHRRDVALVIAGEGPYTSDLRQQCAGLPLYLLGKQEDEQLGRLYSSADLFVFPSRTDTLGQVVMEAQASGLPVLVSADGGPKEMVEDDLTGLVLPGNDLSRWVAAIDELLNDSPRRMRMGQAAAQRMAQHSPSQMFQDFWNAHLLACERASSEPVAPAPPDAHTGNPLKVSADL